MTGRVRPPSEESLSRRQVLQLAGFAGASVLVAGTAVGSYRLFDTAALHPGTGAAYDAWQSWRHSPGPLGAVGAAILAANPHNTQPWLFAVSASEIVLSVDPSRNIGSVDPFRREQHVGLGCALENLVLGCRARGLEPQVTLLPSGPTSGQVAHLALSPAAPRRDASYDAIGHRHTNRGPYARRPVGQDVLDKLGAASASSRTALHWITEPEPRRALGQLLVEAARSVVADAEQSADGFAWFRADDDAVQRHADGLTLDAQGLAPLLLTAAKLLPASSRTAGDDFWVTQTREVHTSTAAAYGVITATDPDDRLTQLEVGRLLQRVHLTATQLGLGLQHMNQITERIDRERVLGLPASSASRFAELLPPGSRPLVTFRIGHPLRTARPSPRRALSAVTTT